MHFNFGMNAANILWILRFAAELVLLVVLLGRDRIQRFPWFTASIAVLTLQQMMVKLLYGRLPQITMFAIIILLADLIAVLAIGVLIEIARRSFSGASHRAWSMGILAVALPGIVVTALWGHWPAWRTFTAHTEFALLGLGQLVAQKVELFSAVATAALGVLVVALGSRYGAGWRSHSQQIVIGLSTVSLSQIGVQVILQILAKTAAPHTMAEYRHLLALRDRILDGSSAVFLAALLWWIVFLWLDEPGKGASTEETAEDTPETTSEPAQ